MQLRVNVSFTTINLVSLPSVCACILNRNAYKFDYATFMTPIPRLDVNSKGHLSLTLQRHLCRLQTGASKESVKTNHPLSRRPISSLCARLLNPWWLRTKAHTQLAMDQLYIESALVVRLLRGVLNNHIHFAICTFSEGTQGGNRIEWGQTLQAFFFVGPL